ncbi:uncharacterized protein A4U43_C07F2480 [Asparagus officinalis]|uniref:Uncharacterized protein n=1 Tax=Asparagus officinalis TaxID=4686 RepID=A0A5P1EDS1_ASPOF|nr:uncharacterized protein A4U43_C07F2480 [Asparagus officinalis]
MRKFDPWAVFFRREWNRNWPFLAGFAITGALITKFTAGLTGELRMVLEQGYASPPADIMPITVLIFLHH